MTELIPDFDLGEIQAPYEVHYHPNIGGGGVIPESQRNGSSTGHSLGEGTYFVQLTSNTGHMCYISYSQGVAWKVLAQTEAGDPDIFRSTDLVKLVVGPSGGTIRVTATPGHAQDDVDQRRMMSLGVFPSALYSPEAGGGGGFLGGFFVWLGGQSDRTSRLRLPLDVHHPVSAGGRQRIPADPGISAGQWEYVHRAFSPPRGLPSGGCMAGIHIGGLLLEDSSHLVPGAVNSLPGKWGNKVFGSLHNDCPGGAVGSTHAETWNGDDTIPHRPRLGCVGPGDPSGAQRSTLTLAVA